MAARLAIGLFCSASDGLPQPFRDAAAEFGRLCAARGFRLVYGGSGRGLMGIAAHAALDRALARAIARGDRLVLLVTGKPPRPESERPHARGAIRAAIADWLAASRHADAIAAVRHAHPRHGGAGALYLVLRRTRG